jgi:hypothetical protein
MDNASNEVTVTSQNHQNVDRSNCHGELEPDVPLKRREHMLLGQGAVHGFSHVDG